jgi:hypothetical protein
MIINSNAIVVGSARHSCTGKVMLSVALQPEAMDAVSHGFVIDLPLDEMGIAGKVDRVVIFCANDPSELAEIIASNSTPDTRITIMNDRGGVERVPDDPGGLS